MFLRYIIINVKCIILETFHKNQLFYRYSDIQYIFWTPIFYKMGSIKIQKINSLQNYQWTDFSYDINYLDIFVLIKTTINPDLWLSDTFKVNVFLNYAILCCNLK